MRGGRACRNHLLGHLAPLAHEVLACTLEYIDFSFGHIHSSGAYPCGYKRGPGFLLTPNFRVILRYNTALAYGLSVAHLSDRLRGEPPFASWPRGDRMLTRPEREELQTLLTQRGFDLGPVDGKVGPKTRAAIRAYQASIGILPDGYAEAGLLERIRPVPQAP